MAKELAATFNGNASAVVLLGETTPKNHSELRQFLKTVVGKTVQNLTREHSLAASGHHRPQKSLLMVFDVLLFTVALPGSSSRLFRYFVN